ncbi:hypothetical protein Trydic_g20297 [Trypoxylus dichotomus]
MSVSRAPNADLNPVEFLQEKLDCQVLKYTLGAARGLVEKTKAANTSKTARENTKIVYGAKGEHNQHR